jgi:hypothetical protein
MRTAGIKFVQKTEPVVHPMKENRRVPLSQLRRRLKIEAYEGETPFAAIDHRPGSVRVKLSQHVGKPAKPVVKTAAKPAAKTAAKPTVKPAVKPVAKAAAPARPVKGKPAKAAKPVKRR